MYATIARFVNSICFKKTRRPYTAMTRGYQKAKEDVREQFGGEALQLKLREAYGPDDLCKFNKFWRYAHPMEVPGVMQEDLMPLFAHFLPGVNTAAIWTLIREQYQNHGQKVVIAGSTITSTIDELTANGSDLDLFIQTTKEQRQRAIWIYVSFFKRARYLVISEGTSYGPSGEEARAGEESDKTRYDFDNNIDDVLMMQNREGRKINLVFSEVPFEQIVIKTDFAHCISYIRFDDGIRPYCVVSDPWAVRDRLLIENSHPAGDLRSSRTFGPCPKKGKPGVQKMAEKRLARFDKYVARGWSTEHLPSTHRWKLTVFAGTAEAEADSGVDV